MSCDRHIYEVGTQWCVECGQGDDGRIAEGWRASMLAEIQASIYDGFVTGTELPVQVAAGKALPAHVTATMPEAPAPQLFPDRHPRLHRLLRRFRPYMRRQMALAIEARAARAAASSSTPRFAPKVITAGGVPVRRANLSAVSVR